MYFIWDGIRCLDYLETRPEVDQNQIACAGCSGGGALTQYLSAIDERITLAVPTSWIAESTLLTVDPGLHTESWFPGMCDPYGPGTRQLLACIAPRPLLILGNKQDAEFPPESMKRVADDTQSLYKRLGIEARFQYTSVPTQHGFWPEARRELYRFLNHHFQQGQQNDLEPVVINEVTQNNKPVESSVEANEEPLEPTNTTQNADIEHTPPQILDEQNNVVTPCLLYTSDAADE